MPIRITKYYSAICTDCGWRADSCSIEADADSKAAEHRELHAVWKAAAADLAGKVYDVDAPSAPWAGHVSRAVDQAKAAGFDYLVWNGRVYHVDSPIDPTICLGVDVPGLTIASR